MDLEPELESGARKVTRAAADERAEVIVAFWLLVISIYASVVA